MASATLQGLGEMGMCPGKQLQLSRQWLSLPQAPFPEAWLKAHWQGRSMLAASKWTAAPPMPALPHARPPIRAQSLRQWGYPWPHSTVAMVPVFSGPGWEGLVPLWCGSAQWDKTLRLAVCWHPMQTCAGMCRRSFALHPMRSSA